MAQLKRTASGESRPHRSGRLRLVAATAVAAALSGGLLTVNATPATAAPRTPTTPAALTASTAPAPNPALPASDADFNGDGRADIAASAAFTYVGGKKHAGAVVVTYGKTGGTGRSVAYTQNSPGVPGSAEKGDIFGNETAYGDFDGDGYDDLVASAGGEDVGSDKDGGMATVLWGSPSGLKGGTVLKDPRPAQHDGFSEILQAGDFNGDGKDDLALATGTTAVVDVFRGGFTRSGRTGGHSTVKAPVHSEGQNGVRQLHSGDADGDGKEDLIVNGYERDTPQGYNANFWLPGSASGPRASRAQKLPAGVITDLGDTDKDGYEDVVIGNAWDSGIPGSARGGAVHILHGAATGPAYGEWEKFTQNTSGVPGSGEKGDSFGHEFDLGDIDGDGNLDLAVGAPGETIDGVADSGAVTVLYGAADGSGITTRGAKLFTQNTPGVPDSDEKYDFLGTDVHIDDLNGDGRGDVIVGAHGENGGNGAVYPLLARTDGTLRGTSGVYLSTAGLSASGTPRLGANFAD
ncbi:VCBS repeat-containing protein [Streptomyces sp. p1417]|uniref:VCBS repeat-containing protein n=1 Tax=Streptomyces typhae TaxID=2681492 RepID=A0A6L6WYC1_9ACTN|nr:FG-GAP and VCBS repeat-containing protein [Streptomyces typhae]MVO86512.1 VCBS repeat-containing protein [Streptomyces typhae]